MPAPDIAFLITESSYFLSHRRGLADACVKNGLKPLLITNVAADDKDALGDLPVVQLDMRRASHHLLRELVTLVRTWKTIRRIRPKIIHAVALKPVLYGAFAARLLGINVVCALAGLGYLFTSGSLRVRILRRLIILWLRFVLNSPRVSVILQNDDDAEKLLSRKVLKPNQLTIIRGSGVDTQTLRPTPEPDGPPVFAVVSRMLADKGIREVILAARLLRWRGVECRVQLIGEPDSHNPTSLSRHDLECWNAEGVVEWLGYRDDIAQVWRDAHVCVLPSYREGLPKALLEAAACGRPIITTSVPGCRAVVDDGVEGLLVPAQDWVALANAMETLARSPELRVRMGLAARQRAEADFQQGAVMEQTMSLYRRVLGGA
jgi:glycosyltransferase involved in cell wall biosynthesis